MPKPPRRPRSLPRSSDALPEVVAGRRLVAAVDSHQPDLFAPAFSSEPCKPVLSARVPAGERWQYEIKHDCYRAQVHVTGGEVRIFTKSGLDWTDRMPGIAEAARALPVRSAVLDGEAVMAGVEPGSTDFFALHAAMARGRAPETVLIAFDLLALKRR